MFSLERHNHSVFCVLFVSGWSCFSSQSWNGHQTGRVSITLLGKPWTDLLQQKALSNTQGNPKYVRQRKCILFSIVIASLLLYINKFSPIIHFDTLHQEAKLAFISGPRYASILGQHLTIGNTCCVLSLKKAWLHRHHLCLPNQTHWTQGSGLCLTAQNTSSLSLLLYFCMFTQTNTCLCWVCFATHAHLNEFCQSVLLKNITYLYTVYVFYFMLYIFLRMAKRYW